MALENMVYELQGSVPNMDAAYARTLINEAWQDVRRLGGWSFQFAESGFTVPGMLSTGTVTIQFGSPYITGDVNATTAWNTPGIGSIYGSVLTQRQFRSGGTSGAGSIYDIIAYGGNGSVAYGTTATPGSGQTPGTYTVNILDTGNGTGATASIVVQSDGTVNAPPTILTIGANYMQPYITFAEGGTPAQFILNQFGVLTLNRPFSDPLTSFTSLVTGQEYGIYQPYIVAPVKDFSRFLTVFDIANSGWLFVRADRRAVGRDDPQRQIFANPDRVMSLGQDERVGSSTPGWERFEIWPGPQNQYLYQVWFLRFGADLVNLSDTLPVAIPESMVKAKARARCYEQAEANKDPQSVRGAGADYRFLIGAALAQYERELKYARLRDRDRVDIFNTRLSRAAAGPAPVTFNPATGAILAQVGT
jgi:hypothetical protein